MKYKNTFLVFRMLPFFLPWAFRPSFASMHSVAYTGSRDSTFILPVKQTDLIIVRTNNINLSISTWANPVAKLVVTTEPNYWQNYLSVKMRPDSAGILIEVGPVPEDSRRRGNHKLLQPINVTLEVPDGHPFVIESMFGKLDIVSDLKAAQIVFTNGDFTANNIQRLKLDIQFAKAHLGNIDQASIVCSNSTLIAGNCHILELGSMFSTIAVAIVNRLTLTSNNDDFSIADLGVGGGHKSFGSLRIGKLRNGFTLRGENADISFEAIETTVDSVKIDDQFGKLYIPVKGLVNYSVHFEGKFASVKSDFHLKPDRSETEFGDQRFTVKEGKGQENATALSLHCDNCEIDFK
jgi:hypothetical protein